MSFNTMCDFCHKSPEDEFEKRKPAIRSLINKYHADLIALQEVRSGYQLNYFTQDLKKYKIIYRSFGLFDFADPAIIVNTSKFEIIKEHFYWLGPRDGSLSFGWKWALPRQLVWVELKDRNSDQKFIFVTTHFDNRNENLLGSAQTVRKLFENSSVPVIFAGDTNLPVTYETYSVLTKDLFLNSFSISQNKEFGFSSGKDLCYRKKGKIFPDCRVDHVLLSKGDNWISQKFIIDTEKFNDRFPSDHRAIVNDLSLKVSQ